MGGPAGSSNAGGSGGSINVGQLTQGMDVQASGTASENTDGAPQAPPKVNGTAPHAPHDSQSVGERLLAQRRRRGQGQGQASESNEPGSGSAVVVVPLDLTLDLIHELTHNQRQYRPDKDTGGVNLSILHLPVIVGTAIERIKAKVPVRCGTAPVIVACIEWGLKGLGQYPPVQRLLWLKTVFNQRERTPRTGHKQEAGLAKGRNGQSLYGIRGQCLEGIFRAFELGFASKWRENVYLPLSTYTDLKDVMVNGLGLEIQDGAILAIMYTLVDVAGDEMTEDVMVEDDRQEMREIINNFLNHAQVRGEAAEAIMIGWGMLAETER